MGYLADRFKRAPIIGTASLFFGFFVFMSGLAVNAFMLFWTRFGVGVAKSNTITVHSSLIADTYPIGVRGRMGALNTMVGRAIGVASPVLVGGIAALAGGVEGWRWSYLLLGIPVGIFALLSFRIPEPVRGRWEKEDVLGAVHEDPDPVPISIEAAFARLWKIRTMKTVVVAFAAMGFALFTAPVLRNLYLEEHFGLDAFGRGVVETLSGVGIIVAVPFVGKRFDALYRADPSKALATLGMLLLPVSVLIPIQYYMPNSSTTKTSTTPAPLSKPQQAQTLLNRTAKLLRERSSKSATTSSRSIAWRSRLARTHRSSVSGSKRSS